MQAAQIVAPDQAHLIETPVPTPGPDEVLIQVRAAGICGTDIHIYHGEYEAAYPITPGHEFSGVVAAVGADVLRFRPGDRVTADPNIACHHCPACQRNEPNQCHHHRAIGVTCAGAFAEYVLAPSSVVFPIGELSFAAAALVEPLACVVWGLQRVQVQPGDSVLILGAGPMGCLMLQAILMAGAARVVITDPIESRLETARSLGASEARHPDDLDNSAAFDIVADATGIASVLESAFQVVRPRGKVWVFGVVPPDQMAQFNPFQVFRRDLTIIGSFAVNRTFPQAIALLQSGRLQTEPLISHRLPLSGFVEGLHLAEHDPGRMKVQFA